MKNAQTWRLTDHLCKACGGRILQCATNCGITGGGNPVFRCADCGASASGMGPDVLCWCGFSHRGQHHMTAYLCKPFSILSATTRISDDTLSRLMHAWDTTVLPVSNDGLLQERMEDLRHEATTCLQNDPPPRVSRDEFEEWVKTTRRGRGLNLAKSPKGAYLYQSTNLCWAGWLASRLHPQVVNRPTVDRKGE